MKQTEQMQKEKFFVYIHIKTLFINVKKICKMCQIRKKFLAYLQNNLNIQVSDINAI